MICKKCKANIPDTAKFCPKCGAKVEFIIKEKSSNMIICPKCGTPNSPTAKFCKKDGTPLKEQFVKVTPKPEVEKITPTKIEVRKPSRVWIWVIIAVLGSILLAGGYLYYSGIILKKKDTSSLKMIKKGTEVSKPEGSKVIKKTAKALKSKKPYKTSEFLTPQEIISEGEIIYNDVKVYEAIATKDITIDRTFYPEGYPIGNTIATLRKGEKIEVLKIFPNNSDSRYTLKIKTENGKTGYILCDAVKLLKAKGDRSALISIYLSLSYEYECWIEDVDRDINKFNEFVKKFPRSQLAPRALVEIIGLNIYCLQCPLSYKEKEARLNNIKKICKMALGVYNTSKWKENIKGFEDFITQFKQELCRTEIDPQIYGKLITFKKNLMEIVPSPFNSAKEEISTLSKKIIKKPEKSSTAIEPSRIEDKINTELKNKGLKEVVVKVDRNLIGYFYGTVTDPRDKEYAIAIAKKFGELKGVRDAIRVAVPKKEKKVDIDKLENDIRKALNNAGFENITVEVERDLSVTLRGTVKSIEEKNKILQIIHRFKDIKKINDMIFVIE